MNHASRDEVLKALEEVKNDPGLHRHGVASAAGGPGEACPCLVFKSSQNDD